MAVAPNGTEKWKLPFAGLPSSVAFGPDGTISPNAGRVGYVLGRKLCGRQARRHHEVEVRCPVRNPTAAGEARTAPSTPSVAPHTSEQGVKVTFLKSFPFKSTLAMVRALVRWVGGTEESTASRQQLRAAKIRGCGLAWRQKQRFRRPRVSW